MTLPPLVYARPTSLPDAVELLARPGARVLAGGQSLVPALARRTARAELLVDLAGLPGLDGVAVDDGVYSVGALVRQRAVERDPRAPALLVEALREVGHPATRNRGTLVGAIANADPASELPAVALALDARVTIAGPGGRRTLPVTELLAGPGETALAPGELIVALELTRPPATEGSAWVEFAPRRSDLPLVGAAARVDPTTGLRRLVLCGVGPVPVELPATTVTVLAAPSASQVAADPAGPEGPAAGSRLAAGPGRSATGPKPPADGALPADATPPPDVLASLDPPTDARASAALRRRLARVLSTRALQEAERRAAARA